MTKEQIKLRSMIMIALFAAIIGVLAQITIPLPLVPITGQTLAIGLAVTILGATQWNAFRYFVFNYWMCRSTCIR